MPYWNFFPAPEGWGRMPVWGFATVADSRVEGLPEGTRIYGYLPPSSELLVTPAGVGPQGFIEASAHRAELPAAYNSYARTDADPVYDAGQEDQQMLLRPTFFFAPDRVAKRSAEWGREGLEQRLAEAWRPYVQWTDGWLKVIHGEGPEDLRSAYLDLLNGRIDPATAHVLTLAR